METVENFPQPFGCAAPCPRSCPPVPLVGAVGPFFQLKTDAKGSEISRSSAAQSTEAAGVFPDSLVAQQRRRALVLRCRLVGQPPLFHLITDAKVLEIPQDLSANQREPREFLSTL